MRLSKEAAGSRPRPRQVCRRGEEAGLVLVRPGRHRLSSIHGHVMLAGVAERLEESLFDVLAPSMQKSYGRKRRAAAAAAAQAALMGVLAKADGRSGEGGWCVGRL